MKKIKVLFVCIHNSARSQMAEAYLNEFGGNKFYSESAGLESGNLNPIVVKTMKEDGIDISKNSTNTVSKYLKEGRKYDFVITVCDETSGERCPVFPANNKSITRLHWSLSDPSNLSGTEDQKIEETVKIRDQIKKRVNDFIEKFG